MTCPRCQETLNSNVRDGVEIDNCPRCHGVWLDRGELEKLIGRVDADYRRERGRDDDDDDGRGERSGGKRRGSLLGDLFDFG